VTCDVVTFVAKKKEELGKDVEEIARKSRKTPQRKGKGLEKIVRRPEQNARIT